MLSFSCWNILSLYAVLLEADEDAAKLCIEGAKASCGVNFDFGIGVLGFDELGEGFRGCFVLAVADVYSAAVVALDFHIFEYGFQGGLFPFAFFI